MIEAEDLPDPRDSPEAQRLLTLILNSTQRRRGGVIRRHRLALGFVAAIVVAGASLAAALFPGSSETSTGLSAFSSRGNPTSFSSDVGIRGLGTPYVLARFGENVLFRVDRPGASTCYGKGKFKDGKLDVLLLDCTPFPSARTPVLDEVGDKVIDRSTRQTAIDFIFGFAADGVAALRLVDDAGHIVSTAPVTNNVFNFEGVSGRGDAGDMLVAVDAHGHEVWRRFL